jgi:type I restriction enzyme S subunit
MASLNQGILSRVQVPYAPLPEQRAIAEALSDMDALLGALERLIAKKRDLKQAAMQQLLTGQTRLQGFHGEWEVKSLGDLFSFSGGYSASRDQLSADGHCYLHYRWRWRCFGMASKPSCENANSGCARCSIRSSTA